MIDADGVVHELLRDVNGLVSGRIAQKFGHGILTKEGIDRKELARIVFTDKKKLKQLEGIIHPLVTKIIKDEIKAFLKKRREGVLVLDVPLLFESGLYKEVDAVVVVSAKKSIQLRRAAKRLNITLGEAERRLKQQMPLSYKKRLSDFVVDNNGSLKETKNQVQRLWQRIQKIKQ